MLSKKHKGVLELQTNRYVESLLVGDYKTHFKNNGIEFADFREYQIGDDAKNIDFLSSAKVGKTLIKLFEEQRQLEIYFLPFFDESINFEIAGKYKRDIFEEILYVLGISSLKQQNKFGSIFYNSQEKIIFPLGKTKAHFFDYFSRIEKNIFDKKSGNISDKLAEFNNLKIKNSLVFLFTSDLEIDEKQLKIAALKNDLVICNVFHSFENSLDDTGIFGLGDESQQLFVDLGNEEKKQEYRLLRKKKVQNFKSKVIQSGANYLYFDEKMDVFSQLFSFFKNR